MYQEIEIAQLNYQYTVARFERTAATANLFLDHDLPKYLLVKAMREAADRLEAAEEPKRERVTW